MSEFPFEVGFPDRSFKEKFRAAFLKGTPDACVMSIGKSLIGEELELYKIGRGKTRIFYTGGHHGAERLTANVAYAFLRAMSEKEKKKGRLGTIDVRLLLREYTYYVIPLVNPDGAAMSDGLLGDNILRPRQLRMNGGEDFRKWSANARGVDLNHNYDAGFFEYKRIEEREGIVAGRGKFSGEYPESEPESRAVANAVRAVSPSLVLSLHSQGEEVYYSPRNAKTAALAMRAARMLGYERKTPVGTAAYGGLSDYTGAVLGIPSLTVEMGKGENPLPADEYYRHRDRLVNLMARLPALL